MSDVSSAAPPLCTSRYRRRRATHDPFLATVGVLLSTVIVGVLTWLVLRAVGLAAPMLFCLLFGALIFPTDPIAVLGMLKSLSTPRTLETRIAGESLFNDGVARRRVPRTAPDCPDRIGRERRPGDHRGPPSSPRRWSAGSWFGLATGFVVYLMLKRVDDYPVEILISLALVMGGDGLADRLHLSAPLAWSSPA